MAQINSSLCLRNAPIVHERVSRRGHQFSQKLFQLTFCPMISTILEQSQLDRTNQFPATQTTIRELIPGKADKLALKFLKIPTLQV